MYRETNFGKRIDMIALKRVEEHASANCYLQTSVHVLKFLLWAFLSLTYRILDTRNVPTAGCPEPRLSLKKFWRSSCVLSNSGVSKDERHLYSNIIRSNWLCLEKSCNPKHCCGHIRRVQHLLYWNEHWLHKRQHNSWTRYITGRRDGQQIGPSDFLKSLTPAWSALLAW